MKPGKSWFESLFSNDRREAERSLGPPLMAYYWDGAAPVPHRVRDINLTGMYLLTDRRWYPNTLITMTLLRSDKEPTDPDRSIVVTTRVVRSGNDGVGLAFILPRSGKPRDPNSTFAAQADKKSLGEFLARLPNENGHAVLEYVLVAPLMFLLVAKMLVVGGCFCIWVMLAKVGRAAAAYAHRRCSSIHTSPDVWQAALIPPE
ncbi:MAG TPA: PilZ domain-containing protein [Acidobacteriaceae bacterium]|jgi:hypothetical protein